MAVLKSLLAKPIRRIFVAAACVVLLTFSASVVQGRYPEGTGGWSLTSLWSLPTDTDDQSAPANVSQGRHPIADKKPATSDPVKAGLTRWLHRDFQLLGVGKKTSWPYNAELDFAEPPRAWLHMHFELHPPAHVQVRSFQYRIDQIVSGAGHTLDLRSLVLRSTDATGLTGFGLQLAVPIGMRSISTLSGRMKLMVLEKPLKQVVLFPISRYTAHRVSIPDLGKDVWISIKPSKYYGTDHVAITYSHTAYLALDHVRFVTTDQTPYVPQTSGVDDSDPDDRQYVVFYDAKLPEISGITLIFWSHRQVIVPFTFTDIPTTTTGLKKPKEKPKEKPRLTILAQPVTTQPQQTQPGDLKLEIVGQSTPGEPPAAPK